MGPGRTRTGTSDDERDHSMTDLSRIEVNLNTLFEAQNQHLIQTCNNNNVNIEQNAKSIAELNDLILGLAAQVTKLVSSEGKTSTTDGSSHGRGSTGPEDRGNKDVSYAARMTRVDFPKFDGTDLRSWLFKCNQFFQLDETSDCQKVRLAAIHLEGKALLWHQTFIQRSNNVMPTWVQYTEAITARFGELFDDPMADLKALKQLGSVQEYHDNFDALSSRLQLSEEYLLSCYLGGLKDEIQLSVRMFTPSTIQQALCLAKLQEASNKSRQSKNINKGPILPTPGNQPFSKYSSKTIHTSPSVTKQPLTTTTSLNNNRRTLTPAELSEKRAKNLCFWCDEKYVPGHKCKGKKPQFFHIEAEDDDEDGETEIPVEVEVEENNECAQISVEAMEGISAFQTMRVTGHHGKKDLHILLDSGSTHNFIDTSKALKLNCTMEKIAPMSVKVADGGQLICDKIIRGFVWKMQGVSFMADVLLLPLNGSDIVLGIQWFSQLGPVLWDFS
ncbi:uncharacterized protein LOC141679753 [Apium graveolens]|uniref:uncharacterized protein LOC141679753 n=1 Tax=Apium graveolens TaxID=4045 RepID=UPI003D79C2D4